MSEYIELLEEIVAYEMGVDVGVLRMIKYSHPKAYIKFLNDNEKICKEDLE